MQNTEGLTPAERELQEAFGRLKLADVSMDYEQLIFRAGQQSMWRGMRVWQGLAAILVVGLGLSLASQWKWQQDASSVYVKVEQGKLPKMTDHSVKIGGAQDSSPRLHPQSYLLLQRRVLGGDSDNFNWDALNGYYRISKREVNRLTDWRKQL
ncbi:MAG: hypothetical protein JSV03_14775 [Planctomycetota bacterium]|nr:MAG: hypothetical protein JSV03_14775 [Planctomycetota bacterium]